MSSRRRQRDRRERGRRGLWLKLVAVALAAVLLVMLAGAAVAGATVQMWLKDLPDYTSPDAFKVAQATKIYSADGKLLARLYLENRTVIPISAVATDLAEAIVAVEDERFYQHGGVDVPGIMRAAITNAQAGDASEGASTITQQYIRNTILLDERTDITLQRKVREAYLAMELEKRHTKREILEQYLNTVYFGEGAYGAEAASQTFFSKHANQLTLGEAALLAGLPQQPSRLSPFVNPDGALARRTQVLKRMLSNGYIDKAAFDVANAEKLTLKRATEPLQGIYSSPYFVAHVKKILAQQYSKALIFQGGLSVYTTLDSKMQAIAEDSVRRALPNAGDPDAALVSIDPTTGYIKALVGGRDYSASKFNLATQGKRQPGSSFKTFVLAAAIEQGMPPSYQIDGSSPAYIPTKPKPWTPENSEGAGRGMMSLAAATHSSVNAVFARLIWGIGVDKVQDIAKRMGITSELANFPSIALGTSGVTALEMASAYGTLATNGVHRAPVAITKIVGPDGTVVFQAGPKGQRAMSAPVAYATTEVLQGVISKGTASRARIGRPAAGKTGTSQNYRDAWFVGYTPQLVTAVWVGYRAERPMYSVHGRRGFGGTLAAPIWASFMKRAMAGMPIKSFQKAPAPKYNTKKFKIPRSSGSGSGSLADVIKDLEADGYTVKISYVASDKPKGTVLGRSYAGKTVTIRVSTGPATKTTPPKPNPGTTTPTVTPPPPPPPPPPTSTPSP